MLAQYRWWFLYRTCLHMWDMSVCVMARRRQVYGSLHTIVGLFFFACSGPPVSVSFSSRPVNTCFPSKGVCTYLATFTTNSTTTPSEWRRSPDLIKWGCTSPWNTMGVECSDLMNSKAIEPSLFSYAECTSFYTPPVLGFCACHLQKKNQAEADASLCFAHFTL